MGVWCSFSWLHPIHFSSLDCHYIYRYPSFAYTASSSVGKYRFPKHGSSHISRFSDESSESSGCYCIAYVWIHIFQNILKRSPIYSVTLTRYVLEPFVPTTWCQWIVSEVENKPSSLQYNWHIGRYSAESRKWIRILSHNQTFIMHRKHERMLNKCPPNHWVENGNIFLTILFDFFRSIYHVVVGIT